MSGQDEDNDRHERQQYGRSHDVEQEVLGLAFQFHIKLDVRSAESRAWHYVYAHNVPLTVATVIVHVQRRIPITAQHHFSRQHTCAVIQRSGCVTDKPSYFHSQWRQFSKWLAIGPGKY